MIWPYPPIPISPLNMLQEQQMGEEHRNWRILVCCMLLNQTHGRQVRPMIAQFFEMNSSPEEFLENAGIDARRDRLLSMLRPLGFKNRRLENLTNMSKDVVAMGDRVKGFVDASWVRAVRGCGPYARDSIAIFVYGSEENVSSDTWLNDYIEWRRKWLLDSAKP